MAGYGGGPGRAGLRRHGGEAVATQLAAEQARLAEVQEQRRRLAGELLHMQRQALELSRWLAKEEARCEVCGSPAPRQTLRADRRCMMGVAGSVTGGGVTAGFCEQHQVGNLCDLHETYSFRKPQVSCQEAQILTFGLTEQHWKVKLRSYFQSLKHFRKISGSRSKAQIG